MKRTNSKEILAVITGAVGLGYYLSQFQPDTASYLWTAQLLWLGFIGLCLLNKDKSNHTPDRSDKTKQFFSNILIQSAISLLNLCLIAFIVATQDGLASKQQNISISYLFSSLSLIGLSSLIFYIIHIKKDAATIRTIVCCYSSEKTKQRLNSLFNMISNYIKGFCQLCYSIYFIILIIILLNLNLGYDAFNSALSSNFYITLLSLLSSLFILSFLKKNLFRFKTRHSYLGAMIIGLPILILSIFILCQYMLLDVFNHISTPTLSDIHIDSNLTPYCWLLFIPNIAAYFARTSKARTLSGHIILLLPAPVILSSILWFYPSVLDHLTTSPILLSCLICFSLSTLLYLLQKEKYQESLAFARSTSFTSTPSAKALDHFFIKYGALIILFLWVFSFSQIFSFFVYTQLFLIPIIYCAANINGCVDLLRRFNLFSKSKQHIT